MKNVKSHRAHNQMLTPTPPNFNCKSPPFLIKVKGWLKRHNREATAIRAF